MDQFDEFDHCVITVNDLNEATFFYGTILREIMDDAWVRDHWSYFRTTDIIQARRQMSNGRIYSEARLPAPHGTVGFGEALIPIFLNQDHVQEPPPEKLRGTPRLALPVTPQELERVAPTFEKYQIPFEGPVEYAAPCPTARAVYFKDPSGNFMELACPRAWAE